MVTDTVTLSYVVTRTISLTVDVTPDEAREARDLNETCAEERWRWYERTAHGRWDAATAEPAPGLVVGEERDVAGPLVYYRADHLRTCENIPNGREFPLLFQQFNPDGNERREWVIAPREVLPAGHGTVSKYVQGCRCDDCRVGQREYARELRRRHRNGGYVRPKRAAS